VEGRTKLYFSTTETKDKLLAHWILSNAEVDIREALGIFGFGYPEKPLKPPVDAGLPKGKMSWYKFDEKIASPMCQRYQEIADILERYNDEWLTLIEELTVKKEK
jgi:hypothetical protein